MMGGEGEVMYEGSVQEGSHCARCNSSNDTVSMLYVVTTGHRWDGSSDRDP